MIARKEIAVTGMGLVTSLGWGLEVNWRRLVGGESGIKSIERFSTEGLRSKVAATIDFGPSDTGYSRDRGLMCLDSAIRDALEEACLGGAAISRSRMVLAVPPLDHTWMQRLDLMGRNAAGDIQLQTPPRRGQTDGNSVGLNGAQAETLTSILIDSVCTELCRRFSFTGVPIVVQTACSSGCSAIQIGSELIRWGQADRVVVAGVDASVTPENIMKFGLLGTLSSLDVEPRRASRPFDRKRDGFVMGEGGAAMILERRKAAEGRGAKILGYVDGCGESVDISHRTRSDPESRAIVECMTAALGQAGIDPEGIGYINAHGTSTRENDRAEAIGILSVFGERAYDMPVSSSKSMIGHTLSAAGVIEAVITLKALETGLLPPTINYSEPDPDIPLNVIPNAAIKENPKYALSNGFGFGGQNMSIVLSRADA